MKLYSLFLSFAFVLSSPTFAGATKYTCKNAPNSKGGPLEIDLQERVAYRFQSREKWPITSVTNDYITMVRMKDVGGGVAVFEIATGWLHMVDLGIFCDVKIKNCEPSISKLQGFDPRPMSCSKIPIE